MFSNMSLTISTPARYAVYMRTGPTSFDRIAVYANGAEAFADQTLSDLTEGGLIIDRDTKAYRMSGSAEWEPLDIPEPMGQGSEVHVMEVDPG